MKKTGENNRRFTCYKEKRRKQQEFVLLNYKNHDNRRGILCMMRSLYTLTFADFNIKLHKGIWIVSYNLCLNLKGRHKIIPSFDRIE